MRPITADDRTAAEMAYKTATEMPPGETPMRPWERLEPGLQTLLTRTATAAADEVRRECLHRAGSYLLNTLRTLCAGRAELPQMLQACVELTAAGAAAVGGGAADSSSTLTTTN